MSAGSASFTAYPDHAPIAWRLRYFEEDGQVLLTGDVEGAGSIAFLSDPADVLRELDAARQLVVDHLVETVGIPATVIAERQLLADILREIGADLPSPLAHRIRSTIAGDQPEPTGRSTVAALAERIAAGHQDNCPGPDCFCIVDRTPVTVGGGA